MAMRFVQLERFGPPEVMRWAEGPLPTPGPGEVLVEIEAIGVNFGDLMVRRGEYRRDQSLDFTPGFEAAGTVLATTADGPPVGSRVVAFTENGGGYATHLVVGADRVYAVDPAVSSLDAAALFVQGVTAHYAVHRYGRVAAGETVLVPAGSGGLGGICIQLAKIAGARAIATASTAEKLEVVRSHGADEAILSDPETLAATVRELTDGRGADVIVDGVGGPLFKPAMRSLAFNGRYVVMGSASQEPAEIDVRALMPRTQTISGFVVARVAEADPREPQATFDAVQKLFREGLLHPRVTLMGPADLPRAHELIESRRLTGKIVIDLAGDF
ncbi:MAG TPA: NADPH:quinone oxidoreductase family protein [Solirubrobacterales bacterium]|nr:NADPH:quinone oxidoreductase family protein [Solirubrobacterales bacterium]